MGKDSSGESLEEILASIRRSLAEQVTSVLEEDAPPPAETLPESIPPADLDEPPIPASLSLHLAARPETGLGSGAGQSVPAPGVEALPVPGGIAGMAAAPAAAALPMAGDAPIPGSSASPAVAPAPIAAAAQGVASAAAEAATQGQPDPLWFLSQEAAARAGGPSAAGAIEPARPDAPVPAPPLGAAPQGAPDAKPSRLGAVRGPLPPFFGSPAAGVVKVDFVPDPPARQASDPALPLPPTSLAPHPFDSVRTVNGEAPRTAEGAGAMRASSIFGPPPTDGRVPGGADAAAPQIQALEAMVAELLRPMLRRWLDENMPRLVSAALKAEAELMSRRDPKKP